MKTLLKFAAAATGVLMLAACSGTSGQPGASDADKQYSIGIAQIVSHPSLDALRTETISALAEDGFVEGENLKIETANAQGDQSTLSATANAWKAQQMDAVVAIATPTAQAMVQAMPPNRPIIFTGVTDPVKAQLVDSWEKPGKNVTGLSDINPIDKQIGLIKQVKPDAKTIGIVYSSAEANSEIQVELAKEEAAKQGLTIETATITNSSEVQQAAQSLNVDAFFVPTDNTVVSAFESMVQVAEQKKIPLISADPDSVERGAVGAWAVDYHAMGKQTGHMVAKILRGQQPADTPVETGEATLTINTAAAQRMGVTIPEDVAQAAGKTVNK